MQLTGIRYVILGKENLSFFKQQAGIVLANHSSALDIPTLEMLFGSNPRVWLSKDLYGRIPLYGWLLHRMHILLDRSDVEKSSIAVLRKSHAKVAGARRHLVLFPEGKRYSDGNVHKFYEGFALLAAKLNRPIVPIAIFGLHKVYPKRSLLVDSSASIVKISIGKPMWYRKDMSRKEFVEQVHSWFTQEITKLSN